MEEMMVQAKSAYEVNMEGNDWCLVSNNIQFNQEDVAASVLQTETLRDGKSSQLTPAQREKRHRLKLKGKLTFLHGLVPGCSKITGQLQMLEQIIKYVESLQRQVEELTAENKGLKEQIELLQHQSVSVQLSSLEMIHMNELLNQREDMDPVNAASTLSDRGILVQNANVCQFEVESQWNAAEAPRDVGLLVQEASCGHGNEPQCAKFSSGGAEDEPSALGGISGEPSAMIVTWDNSNKRNRSEEDAEVDQPKGGQPPNGAAKDNTANQEKGDRNLTITTGDIMGKQGRGGSQASDPPTKEYIYIGVRRRKQTMSPVQAETFISMKHSSSHLISNGDPAGAITDMLMKLEADDESTVKFSDFTGLAGERIKVGKYSAPLSLHPIVKDIVDVYGDVSATGKMNPFVAEAIYIMFCASVKQMSNPRLEQVTEDRILKWRDAIKDALRNNFKVDFAMDQLKKIACAYIGLMEHVKLENEALRMFK